MTGKTEEIFIAFDFPDEFIEKVFRASPMAGFDCYIAFEYEIEFIAIKIARDPDRIGPIIELDRLTYKDSHMPSARSIFRPCITHPENLGFDSLENLIDSLRVVKHFIEITH